MGLGAQQCMKVQHLYIASSSISLYPGSLGSVLHSAIYFLIKCYRTPKDPNLFSLLPNSSSSLYHALRVFLSVMKKTLIPNRSKYSRQT